MNGASMLRVDDARLRIDGLALPDAPPMSSPDESTPPPPPQPEASDNPLAMPIQFMRGVGPQRAELLAKLNVKTVEDLLLYAPRDVLDFSDVRDATTLEADLLQTVRGKVVDVGFKSTRNGTMTAVLIQSGNDFVRGVWFNQHWMFRKFQHGQLVLFSGKPKRKEARWEFSNPHTQWLSIDAEDEDATAMRVVLPRYGLTEGLKMPELRRITRAAVEDFGHLIPDCLPPDVIEKWKLTTMTAALRGLHIPESRAEYELARRRLIFEDLLEFQLAVALRRRIWRDERAAPKLPTTQKIDARIRRLFPFQFTAGQNQAVQDLARDLGSGQAMHRLLQADVGAGKTAIAIYGMLVAVANDHQAVLMAPTELLASQHWQTVERALSESRVKRALLTGNLTAAQRRETLAQIASGEVQLIVGTQAIIQEGVRFKNLGLAVIDEQHKFGVGQRAHFSSGEHKPHVLVMTATPIPRSLCLTQFGDLDLTVVSDQPPGRQPVKTYRVHNAPLRQRNWKFIRERLTEGRQVYIVCPRVGEAADESPTLFDDEISTGGATGADELLGSSEEVFRQLSDGELKDFKVGLVHGRMDRQQKADVMEAFRSGEVQALVSTTVIEVGVDVPNATVIVIQQAERFGLSQLHQLRGRVGRGRYQGYCFLFSDASAPEVVKRLTALEQYTDGFQIAEADFELRGPGDVLGVRQHGALPLKVADLLRDQKLVEETREVAFELVRSGEFDGPHFAALKQQVLDRFGLLMELSRTG